MKNSIHPKKLLLTKWTAVHPINKEKHFLVVKVIEPEE
ncbi:MAG: TIGR02450 family Trp-rich protein, partial [Polynucleobacter victoriensis]